MNNKKLPERPACIPEPEEGWVYVGEGCEDRVGPMSLDIAAYYGHGWRYDKWAGNGSSVVYAVHKDAPDEIWERFGFTGSPLKPKEDPLLKEVLETQQQLAVQEGIAHQTRMILSTHLTNHYGQGIPLQGNQRVQETLERATGILHAKPSTPEVPRDQVWVLKNKEHGPLQTSEFRARHVCLEENEDGTLNVWGKDENHDILWFLQGILWFYRKDTIVQQKERV